MPATLLVRNGDSANEFTIDGEVTIGRSPDNAVVLDDLAVSRHHAAIRPASNGWDIIDLGSAGGTRVGTASLEPRTPHHVGAGAVVAIGPYRIELNTGAAAPGAAATVVQAGAATVVAAGSSRGGNA